MQSASYAGRTVRGTGHGEVVEVLGVRITAGALAEEETVDVRALALELGVSATVTREALKVLAVKGLVAARQKRGTYVRPRPHWNVFDADVIRWTLDGPRGGRLLREFAGLRALLEPSAARLAARRRVPEDLLALETALAAMASASDTRALAVADAAFHHALLSAVGNGTLVRLGRLLDPDPELRDLIVHAGRGISDPLPAHRAILRAVRGGDPEAAALATAAVLAGAPEQEARAVPGTA